MILRIDLKYQYLRVSVSITHAYMRAIHRLQNECRHICAKRFGESKRIEKPPDVLGRDLCYCSCA